MDSTLLPSPFRGQPRGAGGGGGVERSLHNNMGPVFIFLMLSFSIILSILFFIFSSLSLLLYVFTYVLSLLSSIFPFVSY